MKKSNLLILLFCFSLQVSPSGLAAEDYTVPRTEWGQADLQGVWNFTSNVPMQRPEHFGQRQFLTDDEVAAIRIQRLELGAGASVAPPPSGIESYSRNIWVENARFDGDVRTSHIVYPSNGRMPPLVEGIENLPGGVVEAAGQRPVRFVVGGISRDGPEDRGLSERCIVGFNAGPPFTPSLYNNNVQIVQSKDTVVLMTEMIHDARVVPLYDSAAELAELDDIVRLYTGDSRGYWDGDTLVIVTKNFNDLSPSFGSTGTSYDKVLTEKLTRVGPYTVDYEFTVDDPSTYSDIFTGIVSMTKVDGLLYEYACHEGNYGMVNILRGARVQERLEAEGLL